jgi:hypothetical protein
MTRFHAIYEKGKRVGEKTGPIMRGAAATLGQPVDRHGTAILDPSRTPAGGLFLVRCCLVSRRGQGSADRLCIPAAVLSKCHVGPPGGHFGRAKMGSQVLRLAFWVGQMSTSESTYAHARRVNGQRQSMAVRAVYSISSPSRHNGGGVWCGLDSRAPDDGWRV